MDFLHRLIKGKICELVFASIIAKSNDFTILPTGFESVLPQLTQLSLHEKKDLQIDSLRSSPDFLLLSKSKKKSFFVEVKYRKEIHKEDLINICKKTVAHWPQTFLFIFTPHEMYFDSCDEILNNSGLISLAKNSVLNIEDPEQYLEVIRSFIQQ